MYVLAIAKPVGGFYKKRMKMTKRSTNFSQWRKAGTTKDVADLFEKFGVTADDLRKYQKEKSGTRRRKYTCYMCGNNVESEISNYDNSTVCPSCENGVFVGMV
jgi:rubrerythrin